MKVLSVQQPWATMICSGIKDVENRTWKPQTNPGKMLIHASKKFTFGMLNQMPWEWGSSILNHMQFGNLPQPNGFPAGCIIGYVTLDRVETTSDSAWAVPDEQYKWVLKDAYVFDEPIDGVKGKLHLFDYPLDEDNLPAAHKVEIRMPRREGEELVVPVCRQNWDELSAYKGNNNESFTLDLSNDIVDTLCKPGVYALEPIQSIRFEYGDKGVRFEVDGKQSGSFFPADDEGNALKFASIYSEEPVNRPMCKYTLGKKLADGEVAETREWPVVEENAEETEKTDSASMEEEQKPTPRFKPGDRVFATADECYVNYIPNEYTIRGVDTFLNEMDEWIVEYALKGKRMPVEEKYLFATEKEAQYDLAQQCIDRTKSCFNVIVNRFKNLGMDIDQKAMLEMLKDKLGI